MRILCARDLTVSVGGRPLVSGVNLDIEPAQAWAILGRNGSGKSTLLLTLAGVGAKPQGEVRLREKPLADWNSRELARFRAVLLQDTDSLFPASVLDTVLGGRYAHRNAWWHDHHEDITAAEAALAAVELADFAHRRLDTLSGGERRRVAFAAVLAQDPTLYLLDEPGNHLDFKHHVLALKLIARAVQEQRRAALIVMHDVNMALRFCDHALLLFGDGRALAGPCGRVINEQTLADLYQHPVRRFTGDGQPIFLPA